MIAVAYDKAAIQAEIRYLDDCPQQYPQAVQMYFEHYGLDYPDAQHQFGWFQSRGLKLAGHVWIPCGTAALGCGAINTNPSILMEAGWQPPSEARWMGDTPCLPNDNPPVVAGKETKMVIVLHGYLNHTGQMKHLIGALLEYGYVVGSFDLPGHGLSEGKAAAVGALSDYTTALEDFVSATQWVCPDKLHLIGFSNGATVGIDELLSKRSELFDKVVLAGPLVQWAGYQPSKAMYLLLCPFTDRVDRMLQINTSDENYLSFNRNEDYLHCPCVSLDWVKALYDWNGRFEKLPTCNRQILIIQGSRDSTVDWKYNLKQLGKKFPAAKVEMIKGARHELFNESTALREKSITTIMTYLQKME
jgi:alpha-beta hydrolase superfamily lysophospholipase